MALLFPYPTSVLTNITCRHIMKSETKLCFPGTLKSSSQNQGNTTANISEMYSI